MESSYITTTPSDVPTVCSIGDSPTTITSVTESFTKVVVVKASSTVTCDDYTNCAANILANPDIAGLGVSINRRLGSYITNIDAGHSCVLGSRLYRSVLIGICLLAWILV
jgi:hypothetical protein